MAGKTKAPSNSVSQPGRPDDGTQTVDTTARIIDAWLQDMGSQPEPAVYVETQDELLETPFFPVNALLSARLHRKGKTRSNRFGGFRINGEYRKPGRWRDVNHLVTVDSFLGRRLDVTFYPAKRQNLFGCCDSLMASIYSPAPLNAWLDRGDPFDSLRRDGVIFRWEPDPKNERPVYVSVVWERSTIPTDGKSGWAVRTYRVPDNGFFRIPAGAIERGVPDAALHFSILRANWLRVTPPGSGQSFMLFSQVLQSR